MEWSFDDGEWEADSEFVDEPDPIGQLTWRIQVCDDGSFDVSRSDIELTKRSRTFATLAEAKDFCERKETLLTMERPAITANPIQDTIREYLRGVAGTGPAMFVLRCFVGMMETGEATAADFDAVQPGMSAIVVNHRDSMKAKHRNG